LSFLGFGMGGSARSSAWVIELATRVTSRFLQEGGDRLLSWTVDEGKARLFDTHEAAEAFARRHLSGSFRVVKRIHRMAA
jgi:hypothetical protein